MGNTGIYFWVAHDQMEEHHFTGNHRRPFPVADICVGGSTGKSGRAETRGLKYIIF